MDLQFWAVWAAQGSKELLPPFWGDVLCFHGPKIHSKGQVISKGLFDKLNSSKTTKKFYLTTMILQVDMLLFVFWMTGKRHFEIN